MMLLESNYTLQIPRQFSRTFQSTIPVARTGAGGAGISVRSSYFAPKFDGLEVSNSTSSGVFAISGGANQGNHRHLHNNGEEGFYLERAATIVDGLHLEGNADSGVHIDDARYVYLSNLISTGNGDAGLEFNRANDIESASGDVSCTNCTSIGIIEAL